MANTTPKSSNKLRDTLKKIPNDLFDVDINTKVKVDLLQKQYKKNPGDIINLIRRMLK